MKDRITILFFSLNFFFGFSQIQRTVIIDYNHSTHIEGLPSRTMVNSTLIANEKFSIYEMDFLNNNNILDEEDDDEGNTFLNIKTSSNPYIFKNYSKGIMYSQERITLNPILVVDSLTIFNWKLTNNSKKILSYECKEAELDFRGRNYTAYFTTEIYPNVGPWKFFGLPGAILEIKSDDSVFEISAHKIEITNDIVNIKSPYDNLEDAISWEEFLKKYRRKYKELLSYVSEEGGTVSLPKRKIEVLIED